MKTCMCGKVFDEKQAMFRSFDLQKGYEEQFFCSRECLKQWLTRKKIGMAIALALGIVIAVFFLRGEEPMMAFPFFFIPYTIRQLSGKLHGAGEFISFALVLLSTITVVYPAYKFVQELLEYRNVEKKYGI